MAIYFLRKCFFSLIHLIQEHFWTLNICWRSAQFLFGERFTKIGKTRSRPESNLENNGEWFRSTQPASTNLVMATAEMWAGACNGGRALFPRQMGRFFCNSASISSIGLIIRHCRTQWPFCPSQVSRLDHTLWIQVNVGHYSSAR